MEKNDGVNIILFVILTMLKVLINFPIKAGVF